MRVPLTGYAEVMSHPSVTSAAEFSPHVLREYALLADGERGALVGPRGNFCWLCVPHWDSDAIFSALVGGPGCFAVTPDDRFVWGGQYEPGSLIWRSRWVTEKGITECREALAFPGDQHRAVMLRRVRPDDAPARLRVVLEAAAGFGHHRMTRIRQEDDGVWTGRTGPLYVRISGAGMLEPGGLGHPDHVLAGLLRVRRDQQHDLVLEIGDEPFDDDPPDPDRTWRTTERAWQQAVPDLSDTLAARDATHAAAVITGMTSTGGGMVAAASMSLPERADLGRNYDYRYVWIRDQCFAGQAVEAAVGAHPLLDAAVAFVSARICEDGPRLKPAYTVRGDAVPDERRITLPGYPGGYDVAGNHVNAQFQLDTLGESLLLLAAASRQDRLDADGWRAVEVAASAIEKRWGEAEAGIWELDDEHWTESRLICVAGLKSVCAAGAPAHRMAEWTALADGILADTARRCVHPGGWWQRAPGDARPDAALLLPALRGALAADDPRTVATLDAVEAELAEDNFVYRFRHRPGPLADEEGAFLLCGFMMALAKHQQGDQIAAIRYFERNRSACGPPGLFSEEYDVHQRQMRGNLPQAFVHAALLETAARLSGARG
jgi:hypothetical protein